MSNTGEVENSKERFDRQAEEASEDMLAGRDTPWVEREPHRGEASYTEGGEFVDPVSQQPGGMSGGTSFGSSGAHQGSASADSHPPRGAGGRGVDTPGAFGEENIEEGFVSGADTRDNAIKKLQDL